MKKCALQTNSQTHDISIYAEGLRTQPVVLEGVPGGPQLNDGELVTKLTRSLTLENVKLNQIDHNNWTLSRVTLLLSICIT